MRKTNLRATTALRALALMGAGASAAFITAAPAAAQDYTRGNIVGTVSDDKGTPISGATVTVTSNEQGTVSSTTTDANGTFRVTALATGTYTVVVQVAGNTVVEDRGVQVLAGQNNSFSYQAGGAQATGAAADQASDDGVVVVTGTRVQVDDFASTQTGATLDVQQLVETVPVGRDQTSLILLAPGTTGGDAGFGNLASISGATVAENAYFVNGLNITDFRGFLGASLIPFEFYRTLDVKTGGYQAEYGRALGGVTSAVTKAGSNDLKGGAVIAWSPNWARETSPDTYLARNSDDTRQNIDANFYVSGPVIKDRLFFYGLYSPRYFKNEDTSISQRARLSTRSGSPFYGIKVDAVIADGHRLEGTLFSDKQTQKTRYTAFDINSEEFNQVRGSSVNVSGGRSFIGSYTGQFTDWFTLSGSYGRTRSLGLQSSSPNINLIQSRLTGGAAPTAGIPCPTTGPCANRNDSLYTAFGSVAQNLKDNDLRKVWRVDADLYVDFFGSHHFRAGTDYEDLTSKEDTSYTGTGYIYDFRRNQVRRTYYENKGTFETDMRAVYLQDSWSLLNDRVNLQLGVRGDKFRNYSITGDKYYDSGYNWAPRLGVTFDVFGDKKTKLNAFYGTYYLPVATNTNIRLGGAELFYRQQQNYSGPPTDNNQDGIPDQFTRDPLTGAITNFTPNAGGAICPDAGPDAGARCSGVFSDGLAGPTDTLIAEGLKPSESNEIIVGLSHRFGGGWTAGVDYVRRRLKETLEDVAIDAAVLAYCDAEGIDGDLCASVFTGFHQYVLANPGSDITVRLDGGSACVEEPRLCEVVSLAAADLGYPKAVRKYDAVQFTLDKAFNGLYGFNANYVYTKLRGNFEGGVKSDNNQTDTGLTQDFDQPGLVDNSFGDLANGRKHAFKLYGRVSPFKGVDIGVNAILESPRKFSCIGNHPTDNFAVQYGASSYYCQQPGVGTGTVESTDDIEAITGGGIPAGTEFSIVPRGTAFKTEWNKRIDLGVGFDLAPLSLPGSNFRVDVFNLFNWNQVLDRNEFGDISFGGPNPDYRKITGYQAPRSVRFTLAMRFGEK